MGKLDEIKRYGDTIALADDALQPVAFELLDRLCDEWAYPRYHEIARFLVKHDITSSTTPVQVKDRDTGIIVSDQRMAGLARRRLALEKMRLALSDEHRNRCHPDLDSIHSGMCHCVANPERELNLKRYVWTEADAFERILD